LSEGSWADANWMPAAEIISDARTPDGKNEVFMPRNNLITAPDASEKPRITSS
jgi:hypothetical protein